MEAFIMKDVSPWKNGPILRQHKGFEIPQSTLSILLFVINTYAIAYNDLLKHVLEHHVLWTS